jgi:hypothetical protein
MWALIPMFRRRSIAVLTAFLCPVSGKKEPAF